MITEDEVCNLLKAYTEEFIGLENLITVSLPSSWEKSKYSLGPVNLEFTTEDTLEFKVVHPKANAGEYSYNFKCKVKEMGIEC